MRYYFFLSRYSISLLYPAKSLQAQMETNILKHLISQTNFKIKCFQ